MMENELVKLICEDCGDSYYGNPFWRTPVCNKCFGDTRFGRLNDKLAQTIADLKTQLAEARNGLKDIAAHEPSEDKSITNYYILQSMANATLDTLAATSREGEDPIADMLAPFKEQDRP